MSNPNPLNTNPEQSSEFSAGNEKPAQQQDNKPKISSTRQALKSHQEMSDNFYKFPELPTKPGMNADKKTALNEAATNSFSSRPSRKVSPTPLTEHYVPVAKGKSWDRFAPSVSRSGFYVPTLHSTGKKGWKFWDWYQGGRKYLSSGRVGDSINKQSEMQGAAEAMVQTIKSDAEKLQNADKNQVIKNIDLEADAQKQRLMEFYFGPDAARKVKINPDNSITFHNATIENQMQTDNAMNADEHKNYKTLCETYNKMPLATDAPAAKKQKQDEALAMISAQCQAIDANAQRLKDNIDDFHEVEKANLDKELESKKQLELENLYTRRVNALKNDADPNSSNDPTLRSIDENGKVPESQIKDFKINGFRVTEEVDKEGNKGYKFHRQTKEERERENKGKYNVFTPMGALRVVGATIASAFRIASAIFLFQWKGLGKDLKEDWSKFTARGPFADTRYSYRQKKAFDKFLDILIKPGHTWVSATEDTTPDEQRQLWLKAQTINPGMKVYIGKSEYKPTKSDEEKLKAIKRQQQQQQKAVRDASTPELKTRHVDELLEKGQIEKLGDAELTTAQRAKRDFVRAFRDWLEDTFRGDPEAKEQFQEWWYEKGGQKAYQQWEQHPFYGTDKAVQDYQTEKGQPVNPQDNKGKLGTWFEKSNGKAQFDDYQAEAQQHAVTTGRGPS